jgi:hypothetical protein
MSKKNEIRSGDRVQVDFNNSQFTLGTSLLVDHVPTATGDSWVFIDPQKEEIYYVSEGCTITKRP